MCCVCRWDTEEKLIRCRCEGCKCPRFRYLHHQGSWHLMCKCKHSALEHNINGKPSGCKMKVCQCLCFQTSFSCQCGKSWNNHDTIVETAIEREAKGKSLDSTIVKHRIKQKKREGCGKCVGCKCRMTCYLAKK